MCRCFRLVGAPRPIRTEDSHFASARPAVACLAGDLKTVTHPEHGTTCFSVRGNFLHYRAEASNRTGPEVIAVTGAARQYDYIGAAKIVILVPEIHGFFTKYLGDGVERVVVAVRAGKGDDSELHNSQSA